MIACTCPQCGEPMDVPDSRRGALETCPRCGRLFEVHASKPPAAEPTLVVVVRTFHCHRCGGRIGSRAHVGQTVQCPTCRLDTLVPPPPGLGSRPLFGSGQRISPGSVIICPNPNCGYQGPSARIDNGSTLALVLWFLLGVVPGLIYAVFFFNVRTYCPKCGMQLRKEYAAAPSARYRM